MPSNIQGLIQTIVQLRQLQLQEQAQRLSEQQLGISRGNEQTGALAGFQNIAQGLNDPSALAPLAGQFAQNTGLTPDALSTIATNTRPAVSPGVSARDKALAAIFEHVPEYFHGLPETERNQASADVISQIASGQDVGSAAMSHVQSDFLNRAPPEVRDQIVKIGKGLAPGASEQAQLQLGYANYRLNERQTEMQLGFEDLRTRAALQEAQSRLSKGAFDAATSLVEKRSEFLTNMAKTSATLTREGAQTYVDQLNSFNEQLRQIAPEIYGPKGTHPLQDLPTGKTVGATGFLPFLSSWLSKPPGQ